jgi:chemotaxis protein MotB
MKRFSGPWFLSPSALVLVLVLAAGCVTRGTHREVVAERDAIQADKERLEERVRLLETSSQSLDAQRVALIDEMEDLRRMQGTLESDIARLRKTEAELSDHLAAREAELARRRQEVDRLHGTYEGLVSDLEAEVAAGQIEIEQLREGLRLNLTQEVLFASGSAEVNASGRSVLTKVAERVATLPHQIEVQGHTDDVPIHSERYPTNWELAGARASRVVRILAERGVGPERLSAVSFAEYAPVASNDSDVGRAKNRRIEITLQPLSGPGAVAAEPGAPSGASEEEPAQPAAPAGTAAAP